MVFQLRLLVKPLLFVLLFTLFFSYSFGQTPSNDECTGAITLTVNPDKVCVSSYTGGIGYATQSFPACQSAGNGAKDVWFKFTALATTERVTINAGSWDWVFEVFSGNCGSLTSIGCSNAGGYGEPENALFKNLTVGNTYYIRLYDYWSNASPSVQFTICITTSNVLVDNDDCTGAMEVPTTPMGSSLISVGMNNTGASQSMPGCYGIADDDVWFKFTATSPRHIIHVSTNDYINPVIQLFSGDCSNLTPIACRYNTASASDFADCDVSGLVPGNVYYYRVYGSGYDRGTNIGTFIRTVPPPPANDEPGGAIALTVNTDSTCTNTYQGSMDYPTQSFPSCVASGYDAKDLWYKFTAVSSSQRITVSSPTHENYVFQVYSGTADNLNSIACVNTGGYAEPDIALLTNLTVGQTYYLRVYIYIGEGYPSQKFTICISSANTGVDNDNCSGALTVIPSLDATAGTSVGVNNAAATQSMPGCYGSAEDDVWFKFTATSTRHRIVVETFNDINPVLEVFTGTCANLVSKGCYYIAGSSSYGYVYADMTTLVPGTTYYYRVYGSGANNIRTNIGTYVVTPPPPPSNDECTGAISIPVNAGNNCNAIYSGNTGYATQSLPNCQQTGYESMDAWYKFTALSSSQRITLTPISSDDFIFEVFSGTCNNLTSLGCVNTGTMGEPDLTLLNNLVPGNTYYIRVYRNFGGASTSFRFSICIQSVNTAVDNDDPAGALTVIPATDPSSPATSVGANNAGATQSMPGCYGSAEDDIWFKFTATSSHHVIVVNTNEIINPVVEIFSGTPSSLTSISCRYLNSSGYDQVMADLTTLTPRQTYYYRAYGSPNNNVRTNIGTYIQTYPSGTLPVKISGFTLQSGHSINILKWTSETEINNKGFELQFSRDGIVFTDLAFIPTKSANGNSGVALNYSFTHSISALGPGKIYYRLKEVDYDGNYQLTPALMATIRSEGFLVFPNPARNSLTITMAHPENSTYSVFDHLGREMLKGHLNNNTLDISRLVQGQYILSVRSNELNWVSSFVKLQ